MEARFGKWRLGIGEEGGLYQPPGIDYLEVVGLVPEGMVMAAFEIIVMFVRY